MLLVIEGVGAPVIQNEQLDSRELVDEAREATVETGQAQVFEQARHPQIENGMIEPSSLASEGAPQPGFAGSGLAGDDKILMSFQPGTLRQLLEIFEERYRRKSTLITAQLPVAQWHDMIGEPTIADAILDRIIHNSHRIALEGDSMRKKKVACPLTDVENSETNTD